MLEKCSVNCSRRSFCFCVIYFDFFFIFQSFFFFFFFVSSKSNFFFFVDLFWLISDLPNTSVFFFFLLLLFLLVTLRFGLISGTSIFCLFLPDFWNPRPTFSMLLFLFDKLIEINFKRRNKNLGGIFLISIEAQGWPWVKARSRRNAVRFWAVKKVEFVLSVFLEILQKKKTYEWCYRFKYSLLLPIVSKWSFRIRVV